MTIHDHSKHSHNWINITIAIVMAVLLLLPLSSLAQQTKIEEGISNKNPATDLWRMVRQRDTEFQGNSQVKNVESGVLINARGDEWATLRTEKLIRYSQYFLGGSLLAILLIYLVMGTSKVDGLPSGNLVQRFKNVERWTHWIMAGLFLGLALTGLVLMFGRGILIPVLGKEAFSGLAVFSKTIHNWSGPLFLASLLVMLFTFVSKNVYAKGDMEWLLKGGGLFSKDHPKAGFFNMGEKIMFWLVILGGLVLSISGLILLFPGFGQVRSTMELSLVVHGISAVFLIALTFGHMYMALVGVEGTTQAMTHGYVDLKWVEEHHALWAEECKEKGKILTAEEFERMQQEKNSSLKSSVSST